MNTIRTFIPSDSVASFKKFANKTQKNVEGFSYTISEPYMKVFSHPVIKENGIRGNAMKVFHEVCDLEVNMPEENGWKLVCTFKDGSFTPVDTSKELVFKNPAHGQDYNKCDVCGHWCKNSYVIENIETGEELQVGCECVKKFGIKSFDYLSKFTDELHKLYDYSLSYSTDNDELKMWGGNPNAIYKNAFKKADLIMSAKAEYDKCPIYKKAYRERGTYYRSPTLTNIETILCGEQFNVNIEYVNKVCEYALSKPTDGDFVEKVYQEALEIELKSGGIPFQREAQISICYKGVQLQQTYIADFICYDCIIIELKAVTELTDTHRAQVYNYLKATGKDLALLVNYGAPQIQIERLFNYHKNRARIGLKE